jgi:hypothetical protein
VISRRMWSCISGLVCDGRFAALGTFPATCKYLPLNQLGERERESERERERERESERDNICDRIVCSG